jgi:hypothetical protein
VISPLIDALVTTHQRFIPSSGATTTTFGSGPQMPSGNLQRSSSEHFTQNVAKPEVSQNTGAGGVTNYQARNQEVLKALTAMTGVSFGFDQRAWRNWYAVEQRRQQPGSINTRRSS